MKIAIAGAAGRMGQMLIREIARTEGCSLAGALEGAGSNMLGREAGEVAGVGTSHRSIKGIKIVSDGGMTTPESSKWASCYCDTRGDGEAS